MQQQRRRCWIGLHSCCFIIDNSFRSTDNIIVHSILMVLLVCLLTLLEKWLYQRAFSKNQVITADRRHNLVGIFWQARQCLTTFIGTDLLSKQLTLTLTLHDSFTVGCLCLYRHLNALN